MTDRPTVLVTGGAGYIGSHAVLALRDEGWSVAVIDNLVTGFRWAVPQDVHFTQGDIEDQPLVAALLREQNVGAIMHFAGSVVVPESVSNPLKYYHNNGQESRVDRERGEMRCAAFHLLLDGRHLWHARGKPGARRRAATAN